MTSKEYLRQIKLLDIRIQKKKDQLADLKDRAQSVSSQPTDSIRVQSSKDGDTIGKKVVQYADLETEIVEATQEFIQVKNSILNQILQLNDARYVELLCKRYVEYKKFELIAVEMVYDFDYVRAMHKHALQAFANMYGLEE